jgi:hypothetical protein
MYLITWYDNPNCKTSTISTAEVHTVFAIASMFDQQKIKYKITDRLGLVGPKHFNWGDFDYWLMGRDEPLY